LPQSARDGELPLKYFIEVLSNRDATEKPSLAELLEAVATVESLRAMAVQCRDLRKTCDGKVEAVRGLNLAIVTGECFGLLGPNGAGKPTTIEILEGLLDPTWADRAAFAGRVSAPLIPERSGAAFASQHRRRLSLLLLRF